MAATKKTSAGTKTGAKARKGMATATTTRGTAEATKTKPTARGTAPKTAAPVKLNDRQRDFLQKIHGAGAVGYQVGPKVEQRTIDALVERKLVKRGAKDKDSGSARYLLTKAGEKHLPTAAPRLAPEPPTTS
jgi:hypothetical protein